MTAPQIPQPLVAPSKPLERGAATTGSQRDRRWHDTFFDPYKHARFPNGRPFNGEREFKSGTSEESVNAGFLQSDLQCGEYFCENPAMGQTPEERAMTLASVWVAPWLPLAKYTRFNYRQKRLTFAYDTMIADERAGLARFWEAAAKAAGESDIIDPNRPDAVPFRIRTLLGSPRAYMNKIRLAQAAQAGDPWLMGAVEPPNEELAKILGLDVQYLGTPQSHGDAAWVAAPAPVVAPPVLTPEQVLSVPVSEVQRMIAAALQQRNDEERARKKAAGDRLKAGKVAAKAKRDAMRVEAGGV